MDVKAWLFLWCAAVLEVAGDYLIRRGRLTAAWPPAVVGMALLATYGVAVTWWFDGRFSTLLGLYVVVFLLVSQAWGWLVDGDRLTPPHLLGVALIVAGGVVIQVWGKAAG